MAAEAGDGLITVREAAKQCGRNMETIRRWIWGGKLPAQKLGNQLFIKRADLAEYCRETATAPYQAGSRSDLISRMRELREEIRARRGDFAEDHAAATIRQLREDRMNDIERALSQTATEEQGVAEEEDFLERAIRLQNKLRARGYKADPAALVRRSRDGRMRELRRSMR